MQTLGITLALILLGTGLVLNTAVLLYFVIRSIRVVLPQGRLRVRKPLTALAIAHR